MVITIILVTHDSLCYLKDCLARIESNTLCPYELIIVDNASKDGSVEWLKTYVNLKHASWMKQIKVLYNQKNKFFPKAVNQALRKAQGEYIAIINADVLVTTDWLTTILERLEELADAAAIGPMIGGETEKSHYYQQGYEERYGKLSYKSPTAPDIERSAFELKSNNQGSYIETKVLCFACVVVRKRAFKEIGGLDERFVLSGDDWEWSLRARSKGWRLYVAEDTFVLHYRKGSIRTLPQEERTKWKKEDQAHWINVLYRYHNPRTMPGKRLTFGQIYGKQTAFLDVSHTHPNMKRLLTWNDLFANDVPYYFSGKKRNKMTHS